MNGKDSARPLAVIRIVFGLVWGVDAWFKWQPGFFVSFTSYFTDAAQGQPAPVVAWINFWGSIANSSPHFFAILVACLETALALMLIFGFFTRTALWISILFPLLIWSTVEGFGGPYAAGSTDIGAACMYALVAAALLIGGSSRAWSVDAVLKEK